MSARLQFKLVAGKSLGPFILGMPINGVIAYLTSREREIHSVKFAFSSARPFDEPVRLVLREQGVRLEFHPRSLQLMHIAVEPVAPERQPGDRSAAADADGDAAALATFQVAVDLDEKRLCDRSFVPDMRSVLEACAPTYAGTLDRATATFKISFENGLEAHFEIPEQYLSQVAAMRDENPVDFGHGNSPVLKRLVVQPPDELLRAEVLRAPSAHNYFAHELVLCKEDVGAFFTARRVAVLFGDSAQRVLALLGDPDSVHYQRAAIGRRADLEELESTPAATLTSGTVSATTALPASSAAPSTTSLPASSAAATHANGVDAQLNQVARAALERDTRPITGYFYRFSLLGVDCFFDARTHALTKLVMHTNMPGHVLFHEYLRCNFCVLQPDCSAFDHLFRSSPAGAADAVHVADDDDAPGALEAPPQPADTAFTFADSFDDIQQRLGGFDRPILHENAVPFGKRHLFRRNHLIVEVTQSRHVASLTLYT